MCPYYYRTNLQKKHGPNVELCLAINKGGEILTEDQINRICRNNYTSCPYYVHKHGSSRPYTPKTNESGGSSGVMGIVFVIIVIAIVTKLLGMW